MAIGSAFGSPSALAARPAPAVSSTLSLPVLQDSTNTTARSAMQAFFHVAMVASPECSNTIDYKENRQVVQ